MPNTDYRRRSPSPRHGRSNRTHDSRGGKRSRSRSRHREEVVRRSPERNGSRTTARHDVRRDERRDTHDDDTSRREHRRDSLPRREAESHRETARDGYERRAASPVARHAHRQASPAHTRRSPRREELQSPVRRRSPVMARPAHETTRSRPHPMDDIDPWSRPKTIDDDPSPAVTKGLHSIYDYQPTSPHRAMLGGRFPGPRREPRIEENITVDIQRKITGISTEHIDRSYNPEMVVLPRRRSEGLEPMFDRDDIRAAMEAAEAVVERRIVKLASAPKKSQDTRTGVSSYDQSHEGFKVELRMAPKRSEVSPEYRDSRRSQRSDQRSREVGRNQGDLRFSLNTKRITKDEPSVERDRSPAERRAVRDRLGTRPSERQRPSERLGRPTTDRVVRPTERLGRETDDRVVRPSERLGGGRPSERLGSGRPSERLGGRPSERVESGRPTERVVRQTVTERSPARADARSRLGDRDKQKKELPDFSRRPDKFTYHEWMDRPEMVPRASTYFDHDDRDGVVLDDQINMSRRGRGGRGRVGPRGRGNRGRGFGGRAFRGEQSTTYRRRSPPRGSANRWEHDKFRDTDEK